MMPLCSSKKKSVFLFVSLEGEKLLVEPEKWRGQNIGNGVWIKEEWLRFQLVNTSWDDQYFFYIYSWGKRMIYVYSNTE